MTNVQSVPTLVSLLLLSWSAALFWLQRRYEKRRRLELLGRVYSDDRDSLQRFRRIMGE